ncbi:DMT family transporter [Croceicoccus sp. BE223]|uniref:DMT family transporter n=1 Tax=Croceicoccus sp. BE223 TaxID=2817716 RepID=UPI002857AC08|nr:DMT family transporter [Croceicoccus sp. BE223]MDR7101010.1 drug/metabolite transporter (DMT)-like permease [Croceicoccus sp. BE223]
MTAHHDAPAAPEAVPEAAAPAPQRTRLSFADPRAFVPFTLVALIWGSTWLVIKDQISDVPPSWSIVYRFAVAAAAMLVLVKVRGERLRVSSRAWPVILLVGLTQFTLNFQFVYRAETHITSGIVALFFALILIPNSILAWFALGERVSRGFVAGSAVAVVGVGMLLSAEYRASGGGTDIMQGVLLAVLATLSASVANVTQASERVHREPFLPLLFFSMLAGLAINVAVALAIDGPPIWDPRPGYLAGIAYLGIAGSVITFPLYFTLIRNMGAGRAAYIGVATPILAMLLSTLFEGFVWTPLTIGGAVLASAGLVLALKARH